jgi:hypothetical protein
MPGPNNPNPNNVLSLIAHGASFFSSTILSIIVPILILSLSTDAVVKANARESINFQLNIMIWGLVAAVLMFVVVGIPMLFVVVIWSLIAPLIAVLKVADNPSQPYRYRFIMHFLG